MPTTRTGRIVYDHRPHLFTYKDVLRIVRVVEPAGAHEIPDVILTIIRGAEDLATIGSTALVALARRGALPAIVPGAALAMAALTTRMIAVAGETALNYIRYHGFEIMTALLNNLGGPFFAVSEEEPGFDTYSMEVP